MALSTYSKDLLQFMYNLTFTPKINPPIHIAKFLETKGQNVSERTIKRWLRYLGDDISYYSRINYASLNLQTIYALMKRPKKGLLKAMPYAVAPFHGYNATTLERFLGVLCPIPAGKEKELKDFFEAAKEQNLIEDYELFPYNQVADAYLPFHEICDLEGNFNFNKEYDISYFESLLEYGIKKPSEQKLSPLVQQNPITVPTIIEFSRKRWSSHKVWFAMRDNLGEKLWPYIKRRKLKIKEKQGAGVALVQRTVRDIQLAHDELFRQVKVFYRPLFSDKHTVTNLLIKLKDPETITDLFKEISQCSIITSFYLPTDLNEKFRITLSTNIENQIKISNEILPKYLDKTYNNKIIFRRKQNNKKLKLNYAELFDPKTCEWEFNLDKYKKALTLLSP